MSKSRLGQFSRSFVQVLVSTTVLLGVLELGARVYEYVFPPLTVDLGQGFTEDSRLFMPDGNGMLRTNPDKVHNFHDQRFSRRAESGTLRIAVLGGSSVNWMDSNLQAWEGRMHKRLLDYDKVEVINCGGRSYGSHRLVLVAQEVMQYDIDVLAIYTGHNEFQELEQLQLAFLDKLTIQKIASNFGLYRVIRDLVGRRQIRELERASRAGTLAETMPELLHIEQRNFTPKEISERTEEFRNNLVRIIKQAQSYGVKVVIGTIPSNYMDPEFPPDRIDEWREIQALYEEGKWDEGKERVGEILSEIPRSQSSPLENTIIREVAAEFGLGLADVEAAITAAEPHGVPGEKFFNDHCHLNEYGNKIHDQTFEEVIVKVLGEE